MFESKNSTRFLSHLQIRLFRYIISEFLICLNQKILLVFGTFMNQTVPIYYIRISDVFESKNSTRFWHIYKSDYSDILYIYIYIYTLYQNFSCKTRCIIKKI